MRKPAWAQSGGPATVPNGPYGDNDSLSSLRSYEQLMQALPDLEIEIVRRHVTDDAIVLQVRIRGTHLAEWRSLPAMARRVDVPLCGIYTFDADDRLAGEEIYYDGATVLRQLGVFHEPQSVLGRVATLATHRITIARALARKLLRA